VVCIFTVIFGWIILHSHRKHQPETVFFSYITPKRPGITTGRGIHYLHHPHARIGNGPVHLEAIAGAHGAFYHQRLYPSYAETNGLPSRPSRYAE